MPHSLHSTLARRKSGTAASQRHGTPRVSAQGLTESYWARRPRSVAPWLAASQRSRSADAQGASRRACDRRRAGGTAAGERSSSTTTCKTRPTPDLRKRVQVDEATGTVVESKPVDALLTELNFPVDELSCRACIMQRTAVFAVGSWPIHVSVGRQVSRTVTQAPTATWRSPRHRLGRVLARVAATTRQAPSKTLRTGSHLPVSTLDSNLRCAPALGPFTTPTGWPTTESLSDLG